jgi:hypothetical protein
MFASFGCTWWVPSLPCHAELKVIAVRMQCTCLIAVVKILPTPIVRAPISQRCVPVEWMVGCAGRELARSKPVPSTGVSTWTTEVIRCGRLCFVTVECSDRTFRAKVRDFSFPRVSTLRVGPGALFVLPARRCRLVDASFSRCETTFISCWNSPKSV